MNGWLSTASAVFAGVFLAAYAHALRQRVGLALARYAAGVKADARTAHAAARARVPRRVYDHDDAA